MPRQIVVTGIGVLTSIGGDRDAFVCSLRSGVCGITSDESDGLGIAARVPAVDLEKRLAALQLPETVRLRARKAAHRAPPSVQISILTALEGWVQAFGPDDIASAAPANIVVAGNNISPAYQYRVHERFAHAPDLIPASYALHFLDTDHVGIVSEVLGIKGEGFTAGGASASGNTAIIQAWRQILHGVCDTCIVVGAMTDLSPLELQAFRNAGALGGSRFAGEPALACRPFDQDREGFIYGQGSASLVIESADSAKARGAKVLGCIAGGAACLDASRLSHPSAEAEARAMRLALEQAGLPAGSVDYVNAHATSSVAGDEAEAKALKEVFAERVGRLRINSTKGLTGHCLHAAGVVEAAATLLQMNGRFLHPNLNLKRPVDGGFGFAGAAAERASIEVALSNSFGFGGINTALVLTP
jgi:malonyl-ACP decarboxylase